MAISVIDEIFGYHTCIGYGSLLKYLAQGINGTPSVTTVTTPAAPAASAAGGYSGTLS